MTPPSGPWSETELAPGFDLAHDLLDAMAHHTADPPGITRVAYGEGEQWAFDRVRDAAEALGAEAQYDFGGNLLLTLPGEDRSRTVQIGSHLDTVPHGGNYDGAAGVVAGLAVQAVFSHAGVKPPVDLTVVITRAEESCWFPESYVGSKIALGRLDPEKLHSVKRSDTGRTLADHIAALGFEPDRVARGDSIIDTSRIVAHIEPHIEQAPVLLNAGVPIGIVTGIRGSFRYRTARCLGEYCHSGAMPRKFRRDAMAATAELIYRMDQYWAEQLARDEDLTVTFGVVATDPEFHSFSKVAGVVDFCIDVRSQDEAALARAHDALVGLTETIASARNVRFELGAKTGSTPAPMDRGLQTRLNQAAEQTGVATRPIASGGGHDASIFALEGVPSGMLFLRNEHGSHNPDEHMEMADLDAAVRLLATFVRQIGA